MVLLSVGLRWSNYTPSARRPNGSLKTAGRCGAALSAIQHSIYYILNAVTQKQIAVINESGVITYFSFLLFETKFIRVFSERYAAITIPITFVTPTENHNGINSPICKIIITKNTCKISWVSNTNLSFLGKTLYRPPIVSSPNGKPHIISMDNTITTENAPAPIIAIINSPP